MIFTFGAFAREITVSVGAGENWKAKREPQFAVWLEDSSGNFVRTLYVTKKASQKRWLFCPDNGRPESLPVWYHASKTNSAKNTEEIFKNESIKRVLFVIDHYSEKFDPKNENLKKIKKFCSNPKSSKLYFYVIFSILNQKDQEFFFKCFQSTINFPEIERIHDLNNHEASVYHKYELKNIDQLEDISTDIPHDYQNYFDKNISYYFKYKKYEGKSFENYVEEEKIDIKNDLNKYFESIYNTNKFKILIKIKDYLNSSPNEEVSFDNDIYKYLPASYFIFNKNEEDDAYSVKPAFPLVEMALNELYEDFSKDNFINIRSEEFKNLEGGPKGTIFDKYMNKWFKNKARTKLFQFNTGDIEVIEIPYVIKKNRPNWTIEDFYHEKEINKEINKNKHLKAIKEKYYNSKLDKKCIIIFQALCSKSIDVYFLIRNNDSYMINSIQMKCSNGYVLDEKLFKRSKLEMTYIKNKFQMLFGIKITSSYITYLGLKEEPKKCALDNESKFFYYSTEQDKFVDINNKEIKELPFYEDCFVSFVEEEQIIECARNIIEGYFPTLKFYFKKFENADTKNLPKNNIIIVKESNKQVLADIYISGGHIEIKQYHEQTIKEEMEKYFTIEIIGE